MKTEKGYFYSEKEIKEIKLLLKMSKQCIGKCKEDKKQLSECLICKKRHANQKIDHAINMLNGKDYMNE